MNLQKMLKSWLCMLVMLFIICGLANASLAQNVTAPTFTPPTAIMTWTDNSSNETGFLVERADALTSNQFVLIGNLGANVQTFTDTSPQIGKTYIYRVCAYNSVGKSGYATAAPYTVQGGPNGDPSNAKVGNGAIDLTAGRKSPSS